MLEVCFNDSVKGALALAQNCGNDRIGGAVGFITASKGLFSFFEKRKARREYMKRQIKLQKTAVPLGGKREDIVGISFGLSENDIVSPICLEACPRKDYVRENFLFDRYNGQEDSEASVNKFWAACIKDIKKLQSNPQTIRVWVDNTPDAQCGLLFIADLLKDAKTEIHSIALPQGITKMEDCSIQYRAWGEVEPQLFGSFLREERVLAEKEVQDLANKWRLLKAENAPLRVVENGCVISAGESYYDNLIREEFPQGACKIAYIIGNALGKQKIPTGDVFIAKRIQHFIDNGELVVLEKSGNGFYGTIVACAK